MQPSLLPHNVHHGLQAVMLVDDWIDLPLKVVVDHIHFLICSRSSEKDQSRGEAMQAGLPMPVTSSHAAGMVDLL
jgi:hypothetical protein